MKSVKKLLREQSASVLPDQDLKRRIEYDAGIFGEDAVTVGGSSAAVAAKKKISTATIAVAAAMAVALSCVFIGIGNKPELPAEEFADFGKIDTATDFYAYGAVSLGNMLDGMTETLSTLSLGGMFDGTTETLSTLSLGGTKDKLAAATTVNPLSSDASASELTVDQKSTLEKYVVFAMGMLGGGTINRTCGASDRAEYEYMLDVSYCDSFGGTAERTLYYNKTEIKDDREYAIVGELVTGNLSYYTEGNYKTKSKGDETEDSIVFKAYTSADDYISMKYEYESEKGESENKYKIEVCSQGKTVESTEISAETEKNQTSYEIEVQRTDGKVAFEFSVAELDRTPVIEVKADFAGDEKKFVMRAKSKDEGGGYDYFYETDGRYGFGEPEKDSDSEKEDEFDKDEESDKEDSFDGDSFTGEPDGQPFGDDFYREESGEQVGGEKRTNALFL